MFEDILLHWIRLGHDERRVLLEIAKRLEAGQEQYGHNLFKKKDIRKEAHEEFLDAAVYLAVETLAP